MWFICPSSFCWRHAAPLVFAAGLLSSVLIGLLYRPLLLAGLAGLAIYLTVTLATAVAIGARSSWKYSPFVALIMPSYHFVYGLGSIVGLFRHGGARAYFRRAASTA